MAFFDIGALITLGAFFLLGRAKGFAWQIAGIASLILGYIAARLFSATVSEVLGLGPGLGSFASWLIIYIVVATGIYLIARGFKRSLKDKELDELDKHLGGILGLLKGGLLVFLVTLVGFTLLPRYRPDILATVTGKITARIVKILEDNVPKASRDALDQPPDLSISADKTPAPARPEPAIEQSPPLPEPALEKTPPARPQVKKQPPPAPIDAQVEEEKAPPAKGTEPFSEDESLPEPTDEPDEPGEKRYDPFRYEPIKPVKPGG